MCTVFSLMLYCAKVYHKKRRENNSRMLLNSRLNIVYFCISIQQSGRNSLQCQPRRAYSGSSARSVSYTHLDVYKRQVLRRIEIQQSAVHIKQQAIIKGQKTPRPFCAKIESIVTIIHDLSAFVNRAGDKILLRQQKAAGMPAAVCFKFE